MWNIDPGRPRARAARLCARLRLAVLGRERRSAPHAATLRRIARDLRHAVDRDELELVYQPKLEAGAMRLTSVEALVRWHHPRLGCIGPDVFIPIAERTGAIVGIDDWVMNRAVRQAALWHDFGPDVRVSINVSRMQMRHADFAGRLGRCLAHHRLPASRLTCEITETAVIEDTVDSRVAFDSLRRLGVQVSVDDFGTGQSSLSALCTLPARELKLDRAFAAALVGNAGARIIVKAVVDMAHALELRVVAEGVETASQRDLMRQAGCDELQGFLFARPMTACALSDWARAHCSASHPATHDVAPQLAVACNDSDISRDAPASSGDDNDIGARRA